MKSSLQQHLPELKLVFVYRAATRLKTLFNFKDRIPSYLSAGIVYIFMSKKIVLSEVEWTLRRGNKETCYCVCITNYKFIYIYIYIERERERATRRGLH